MAPLRCAPLPPGVRYPPRRGASTLLRPGPARPRTGPGRGPRWAPGLRLRPTPTTSTRTAAHRGRATRDPRCARLMRARPGRTDSRADARTHGRPDSRTGGRTDPRTDGLTGGLTDGPPGRRADGPPDGRAGGSSTADRTGPVTGPLGSPGPWIPAPGHGTAGAPRAGPRPVVRARRTGAGHRPVVRRRPPGADGADAPAPWRAATQGPGPPAERPVTSPCPGSAGAAAGRVRRPRAGPSRRVRGRTVRVAPPGPGGSGPGPPR